MREVDRICFPDDLYPLLGLPKYSWWFAYDEGVVVAYAAACKMNKYYFLARGGVLPEKRGNKIQQQLIEKRLEMAKSLNLEGAITYTSVDNISSIKNLKACGFEEWIDAPKKFRSEGFISWIFRFDRKFEEFEQ